MSKKFIFSIIAVLAVSIASIAYALELQDDGAVVGQVDTINIQNGASTSKVGSVGNINLDDLVMTGTLTSDGIIVSSGGSLDVTSPFTIDDSVTISGTITIDDLTLTGTATLITGSNAGEDICTDSNYNLCICGSCS